MNKKKKQLTSYIDKQFGKMRKEAGVDEDEFSAWYEGDWGHDEDDYNQATKKYDAMWKTSQAAKKEVNRYLENKYHAAELSKRIINREKHKKDAELVALTLGSIGALGVITYFGVKTKTGG